MRKLRPTANMLVALVALPWGCGGDVDAPTEPGGGGDGSSSSASTAGPGPATGAGGAGSGTGGVSGPGGAQASSSIGSGGDVGAGGAEGRIGVSCGDSVCEAPDQCLICDPTDGGAPALCVEEFTGNCRVWGMYPPLRMGCDGHEDCAADERCALYEGSLGTYTGCWALDECTQDCGCGGISVVCTTLADCPPCATGCEPYQTPDYLVTVCTF